MEKKIIALEMDKLKKPFSGLAQFCRALGNAFLETPNPFDWLYFVPENALNSFGDTVRYAKAHQLGRYVSKLNPRADLWHWMHQDSPYWPRDSKMPVVLTIHDLSFLHDGKNKPIKPRLKKLQQKIDRASAIVAISQFTAEDIKTHCEIANRPLQVIYNGVSVLDPAQARAPRFSLPKKFLLALGTVLPRKNFIVLIDLLARLDKDFYLVIAGTHHPAYVQDIYEKAARLGIAERVILPGGVNEAEKTWLYQNCSAFFFPSLAEGFGLPPIEAMRFGKPVFLSRSTCLPEIGGKEAYFFDDFEPEHMLEVFQIGMHEYAKDPDKKNRLIAWSHQFQWKEAAEKYVRLYESLLTT